MALVLFLGFLIVVPAPLLETLSLGDEFASVDQKIVIACAIFFIITLSLWVFDSISLITFRNHWMSKSIWATGICSILATSVLIYKQGLGADQKLSGMWQATACYLDYPFSSSIMVGQHTVISAFDPPSKTYAMQSNVDS
jgi:hypothetical protein